MSAQSWMARADETLRAAQHLLQGTFPADAVSKAYYSAFYAATALLATRGLDANSHQAALRLFGREFVKTGLMAQSHGRLLNVMFRDRQSADYKEAPGVTLTEAGQAVEAAAEFVTAASALLDEILADD